MNTTDLVRSNAPSNRGRTTSIDATDVVTDPIILGSYVAQEKDREKGQNKPPASAPRPQVFIDAPELLPHKNKPWLQAYLHQRYDVPLPEPASLPPKLLEAAPSAAIDPTCQIPADLLRFHALLCGATGSGKTRLALHLLYEQLCRGGSLVALDPKEETLWHIAHLAREAGIPSEDIHVLLPRQQGVGCPGWNPLDYRALGVPAHEAVAEFVRLIEESSPSWGARLADVLKNAARLAAYHNLSLYEMVALLRQSDYRDALLKQGTPTHVLSSHVDRAAYAETHDYFSREFSRWSAARQAEAIDPVLNKVRSLLDIPFLRALLCADRSTLDLSSLWKRPKVVLVHLDFRALGSEGTRLLAGLLSYNLFQTALRVGTGSSVPVTLSLDEMGIQERFVGGAMKDILALARSYNLRLMTACQHLGQLSPELREALLTVAFKAFFRLGPSDARPAAGFLCDGSPREETDDDKPGATATASGAITKLVLDVPKRSKYEPPQMEKCKHEITDPWNQPVRVSPMLWAEFARFQLAPENAGRKLAAFRMLLADVPRIYVTSPLDEQVFELSQYLEGVDPKCFDFGGPSPVTLTVRFPRPKVSVLARQSSTTNHSESAADRERRWEQTLLHLGQREAVVSTPEGGARLVKVREVRLPKASMDRNSGMDWSRVVGHRCNGQNEYEVEASWRARRQAMEAVLKDAAPLPVESVEAMQAPVKSAPVQAGRDAAMRATVERARPPKRVQTRRITQTISQVASQTHPPKPTKQSDATAEIVAVVSHKYPAQDTVEFASRQAPSTEPEAADDGSL